MESEVFINNLSTNNRKQQFVELRDSFIDEVVDFEIPQLLSEAIPVLPSPQEVKRRVGRPQKRKVPTTKYAQVNNLDRKKVVLMFEKGKSPSEISDFLQIKIHSVYAIIRRWRKEGKFEKKNRGGPLTIKITPAVSQEIVKSIENQPTISLSKITENIKANLDVSLHPSSVFKHMKTGGLEKHGQFYLFLLFSTIFNFSQ